MRHPLWRHRALRKLIGAACVVFHPDLFPLQRRRRHRLKCRTRQARGNRRESQPARRFAQVQPPVAHQLLEPLGQWTQMLSEQSAAYILKQSLHDGQRLDFRWREPKTREFEGANACSSGVFKATDLRIELNRRVEGVLENIDGAIKRSFGALEPRRELLERDWSSAGCEDGVKLENAVEFVHDKKGVILGPGSFAGLTVTSHVGDGLADVAR